MMLSELRRWGWISSVMLLGGCASDHLDGAAAPPGHVLDERHAVQPSELPQLVRAVDLDDRDGVVEVSLVAEQAEKQYVPSGTARVYAYRDDSARKAATSVPGPLIEATVGDRVIVHLRNELPDPTTIHWHGVRVPNASDGTPVSQLEIPPGGEYRYDFVVRDAGIFWYHPHVHGDAQVERGLQGMLIVHGTTEVRDVDVERNLVLDDVKLDESGALSTETTSDDIMFGRVGNLILANGASGRVASATSGSRERWRIVNTSNGRYFNLRLPGHKLLVIGWDGGLLEHPYESETLLVTPGERYDVVVDLKGDVGSRVALETVHYDRGHALPTSAPQPVFHLRFASEARGAPEPLQHVFGSAVDLVPPSSVTERVFTLNETQGAHHGSDVRFTINGTSFPNVPAISVRQGDVEVWAFQNDSEMDHPMHLHGLFFRVLDVNGVRPAHVGWKDTVNVPAKSRLRLALRYDATGRWLYHCHVLEHAELGMMGEFKVVPPGDALPTPPSSAPDAGAPPPPPPAAHPSTGEGSVNHAGH